MLRSNLFAGDAALEGAASVDARHVTPGAVGPHVGKIQVALAILDGAAILPAERAAAFYGPSTAAAVLAYKQARTIINPARQTTADNIVGVLTMARLDNEMFARQTPAPRSTRSSCARRCACIPSPASNGLAIRMQRIFQAVAL